MSEVNELAKLKAEGVMYERTFQDLEDEARVGGPISYFQLFKELITQIKPGVPLYRISAPALLLAPLSKLQKSTGAFIPNNLIYGLEKCKNAEERFLKILCWRLSNWRTYAREGLRGAKPFNPVLGEYFRCIYRYDDPSNSDPTDETYYISEQVSHHPPVSGMYIKNKYWRVVDTSEFEMNLHFNSLSLQMKGTSQVLFGEGKNLETYTSISPPVYCSGIWQPIIKVSAYGTYILQCEETGWKAEINFVGTKNKVKGKVYLNGVAKWRIEGKLDTVVYQIVYAPRQVSILNLWGPVDDSEEKKVFYDAKDIVEAKVVCQKVWKQKPYESQRKWHPVSVAILEKKFEHAQTLKFNIEEAQRAKAKKRLEAEEPYAPAYFVYDEENTVWVIKKEFGKDIKSLFSDWKKNGNNGGDN